MLRSLYIWPDRPLLSLLVLLVLAMPFLYLARDPMHTLLRRASRAIVRPLRLGARWLTDAAARMRTRNREVLLAHGSRELRLSIDRELERVTILVQRDLEGYPLYKQLGNRLLSAWATLWAGGPLLDVESGYRIFRAGALANALDYYQGYKYSETVEVAVVLSRLGYKVRNDVLVPVPIYRSRTRMVDVVIDLCAIPAAAVRVQRRAPASEPVPSLAKPVAVTAALAAAGLAGAYAGWRMLRASVSRWLKHRRRR